MKPAFSRTERLHDRVGKGSAHNHDRFPRRAVIIAVITIWALFNFLIKGKPPVASQYVHICPSIPPRRPYIPKSNGGFDWKSIAAKHPVTGRLFRLSNTKSLQLAPVQHKFEDFSKDNLRLRTFRQQEVKRVLQRCWRSYRAKAWRRDELSPLSGEGKDPFGGWGATLVDSLDTLWIMGMYDEFEEAVSAAVSIDFGPDTSSLTQLNMFETTIRYLGGFLSAYDMTGCKDKRLLDKAVEIGDMIYASYDTANRMPISRWDPREAVDGIEQYPAANAILAELGSAGLELTRLSQLTGDMRYYDQVVRIANVFETQQSKTSLPGMWPVGVDADKPDLTVGDFYSFGAMADSAYEYLPKMYQLLGGVNAGPQHERMYKAAMDTATKMMFYKPMLPDNADVRIATNLRVVDFNETVIDARGEHLSCFVGGMLALGGRLFGLNDHIRLGRRVTDGCVWAYKHSKHGVMPEIFKMLPCEGDGPCKWNATEYAEQAQDDRFPGFASIDDARYNLRPEAIESVFYLYRITGDESLQEDAWAMFEAIEEATRTQLANAALDDVTMDDPPKEDNMESFWMGETLKYFYLTFSDPSLISLDEFVFNTEAHPFRRPRWQAT